MVRVIPWTLVGLLASVLSSGAVEVASWERLVWRGNPREVWDLADSLEKAGLMRAGEAAALRARAANRPGYWDLYGGSLDSLFASARRSLAQEMDSREDSVWYAALLLDEAYYHARARVAGLADGEAEEACLREVLSFAPGVEQRIRAAVELGRFERFRGPPYGGGPDSTTAAWRRLEAVASSGEAGDWRARVLWQMAMLAAEEGDIDRATGAAEGIKGGFPNSKWAQRAEELVRILRRRELVLHKVDASHGCLVVRASTRNMEGAPVAQLSRIDPRWIRRHARMPRSSERVPEDRAVSVAMHEGASRGEWEASFPLSPGFFRLRLVLEDTVVTSTLGVMNVRLKADGETASVVHDGPRPLRLTWAAAEGRPGTTGERLVPPLLPWRLPTWPALAFVAEDSFAGWHGPPLEGPTWTIIGAEAP